MQPEDITSTLAASWPPRSRSEVIQLQRSLRRGLSFKDQNLAVYLLRRIHRFILSTRHRVERHRQGQVWTMTAPDGRQVQFPLGDFASVHFKALVDKYGQHYERTLINFVCSRIGPGDVFVDVGANVGFVSAFAATTGASVFAMEIQRDLLPLIEQVATINRFDHLRVLHVGASARTGLSVMPRMESNTGTRIEGEPFIAVRPDPRSVVDDFVPVMALDDAFLSRVLLPKLIKVDVEGHEINVIQGAKGIIAAEQTTFVVEFHGHLIPLYGGRPSDLVAAFDLDRWSMSQLTDDGLRPLRGIGDLQPDAHDPNPKLVFEPRLVSVDRSRPKR